jgi:hypothetical protein
MMPAARWPLALSRGPPPDDRRPQRSARQLRLVLHLPTWDDYVGAAFDELIDAGREAPSVAARLVGALDDLLRTVPNNRRAEIEHRRQRLTTMT